jgi:hypothetical protein
MAGRLDDWWMADKLENWLDNWQARLLLGGLARWWTDGWVEGLRTDGRLACWTEDDWQDKRTGGWWEEADRKAGGMSCPGWKTGEWLKGITDEWPEDWRINGWVEGFKTDGWLADKMTVGRASRLDDW